MDSICRRTMTSMNQSMTCPAISPWRSLNHVQKKNTSPKTTSQDHLTLKVIDVPMFVDTFINCEA